MVKGIIGKKVGMTQLFDANGKVVPVTVIEAGPCTVVQKKMCIRDRASVATLKVYFLSAIPAMEFSVMTGFRIISCAVFRCV